VLGTGLGVCFVLFFNLLIFWGTGSQYVVQVILELSHTDLKQTSSCLSLQSAGITGAYHLAQTGVSF
jgi:hypothetical protein